MIGRPSKYTEDMLPKVTELMSVGASLVEVAAALGIDDDTIQDWCNKKSPRYKEDFSATIKDGVKLSAAWWEQQGRENLKNKEFQYVGWYMNMKNRFKWRDRAEVENTGEITHKWAEMTDDELDRAIKARQDRVS